MPRVTVFIVAGLYRIWQKTDWSNGTSYYYCFNLLLLIFSNSNSRDVAFSVNRSNITWAKIFIHTRQKMFHCWFSLTFFHFRKNYSVFVDFYLHIWSSNYVVISSLRHWLIVSNLSFSFQIINPFMRDVEKWSNILWKSCGVHTL